MSQLNWEPPDHGPKYQMVKSFERKVQLLFRMADMLADEGSTVDYDAMHVEITKLAAQLGEELKAIK